MSRAIAFLIGGSIFFLFLSVIAFIALPDRGGLGWGSCSNFSEDSITINNHKISVALADTPAEQARGLSGCDSLPKNSGMLFPYSPAQPATFWMKDMLIPIDIIWIRDGQVIGIEPNVEPPLPHPVWKQGSDLLLYKSPGPITAVLELGAGKSFALDIKAGSRVE